MLPLPMKPPVRKTLVVVALALTLALVWLRPLDRLAQDYTEAGFKRALATFAVARSLNAVISVAQSASVSLSVGAGASVQPGAALDPLDDLIEQFSTLMLGATLSFGAQRLLIGVSAAWPLAALVSALLAAWAAYGWRGLSAPRGLRRVAAGLLLLTLAVPLAALASEAAYRLFLAGEYEAAQARIAAAGAPAVEAPVAGSDEGLLERLKRVWAQNANVGAQLDALRARIGALVEYLVRLGAVFLVQTVVLPLLTFWLLLRLYRTLA
jgi:hypothetical protein